MHEAKSHVISAQTDLDWQISGHISQENCMDFIKELGEQHIPTLGHLSINCQNLTIDDGLALLTVINSLKALSHRLSKLTITGHNDTLNDYFYNQGFLDSNHRIVVEETEAVDETLT